MQLFALPVWLWAAPAFAQQAGTARIYGTVVDPQGAVIAGAKITLLDLDRNQKRAAVANDQGQYAFPQIPIGPYRSRPRSASAWRSTAGRSTTPIAAGKT